MIRRVACCALLLLSAPDATTEIGRTLLEVDQAEAVFGRQMTAPGDVNGDGRSDFAVGAPQYDDGSVRGGRVYLYFGSSSGLPASPSQTLSQAQAGAAFGRTVAIVGDVDGDGFDDLAVGAPRTDGVAIDEGAAYLYHGGAGGVSASPDWTVAGFGLETQFGLVTAGVGDVNGDGFDDLAVTSRFGGVNVRDGHAEVFHGSASGVSTTPSATLDLDTREARTGCDIGGGDFDGDGTSELGVGATLYDSGQSDEGAVFVHAGFGDFLFSDGFEPAEDTRQR